jgi:NhaP-type Na+/H+ or K+/H+ antiporter
MAAGVLLLRRPPVVLLLAPWLPDVRGWREALVAGWFGPVAVAATYYAALAAHRLGETVVWDAVTLVVAASVVVHGVTAVPLTRWVPGGPRAV